MKEIFYLSPNETHKKYDLFVHLRNTRKYGNHSLSVLGPHIWNSLSKEIKQLSSLNALLHKKLVWPKKQALLTSGISLINTSHHECQT